MAVENQHSFHALDKGGNQLLILDFKIFSQLNDVKLNFKKCLFALDLYNNLMFWFSRDNPTRISFSEAGNGICLLGMIDFSCSVRRVSRWPIISLPSFSLSDKLACLIALLCQDNVTSNSLDDFQLFFFNHQAFLTHYIY